MWSGVVESEFDARLVRLEWKGARILRCFDVCPVWFGWNRVSVGHMFEDPDCRASVKIRESFC